MMLKVEIQILKNRPFDLLCAVKNLPKFHRCLKYSKIQLGGDLNSPFAGHLYAMNSRHSKVDAVNCLATRSVLLISMLKKAKSTPTTDMNKDCFDGK